MNAANELMLGGFGVDGSIHRAAGSNLLKACEAVPEVSPGVRCPTGEARLLPGFELPAKYVINTVGPVFESEETSSPLLQSAYENTLRLASRSDIRSIAFPAISCGVYGYPMKDAAKLALSVVSKSIKRDDLKLDVVIFALFKEKAFNIWVEAAKELGMQSVTSDGHSAALIWSTEVQREP